MEPIVFLNGALLPRPQARISPWDHGFLYGYALFETMRAYDGCIFHLEQHLRRLAHSAETLHIPVDASVLEQACYDTLRANRLDSARIRLTVSIGEGGGTPEPPADPRPTVLIVATDYAPPSHEKYRDGFKAIVASMRQNSQSPLSRLKSANCLNCILARKVAKAAGADEAILLNDHGYLCEGSTSNLFLVSDSCLVTPDVDSGCLPGITRQTVVELASELGLEVEQRQTGLDELIQAEEAFVTNSLLEIMPLTQIDDGIIGRGSSRGSRGETTERLTKAYREAVDRETGART